jgi:hypothetical protein
MTWIHNGIVYKVDEKGRFDGGARGGTFTQYPSGMFFGYGKWINSFAEMADLAQYTQRAQYDRSVAFVLAYELNR